LPDMDGDLSRTLRLAADRIDSACGELYLDFTPVRRVAAGELRDLTALVTLAENKAIPVVLGSVNVDVYRVLKLMKLAPRIEFRNGGGVGGRSGPAMKRAGTERSMQSVWKAVRVAAIPLLVLLLASAAWSQQTYVTRFDLFTGYTYLDSPKVNLGEHGFHTQ